MEVGAYYLMLPEIVRQNAEMILDGRGKKIQVNCKLLPAEFMKKYVAHA